MLNMREKTGFSLRLNDKTNGHAAGKNFVLRFSDASNAKFRSFALTLLRRISANPPFLWNSTFKKEFFYAKIFGNL